ncbi:MAG TPA: tetratricopeptide repeat protein [Flavobacteriaceae bacterium]|nr:tetratricopeptide repeat protein [Flavobacteriaceae bacterium]
MNFMLNRTKRKVFFLMLFFSFGILSAQEKDSKKIDKKVNRYMQEAEEALAENNFPLAEANYRKAAALDTSNAVPLYNMGTLYYQKNKASEAVRKLAGAGKTSEKKELKHRAFHNQGNAFMKQKNYKAAVEAYKNALRNDPTDNETRYNLALAKELLEKEQKQNKNNPKKDDKKNDSEGKENKKENEKKKENKDQNKEDSGDKKKDKKEEPKDKKQKDQQDQGEKGEKPKEKQPQQPKPAPGQMSQQQIKNLLEAMKNQEQEVQQKINAQKSKGVKTNTEKDW